MAKADHSKATDLTEEINTVAQNCPNGTSVKFTIESSYHEGWYQYLDSEFGTEANVTTDGDAVTVELTDIREPFDPAKFIVKEDHGLRGPVGKRWRKTSDSHAPSPERGKAAAKAAMTSSVLKRRSRTSDSETKAKTSLQRSWMTTATRRC